jgi:peptidyl-prolyl cis-trans isomerase D
MLEKHKDEFKQDRSRSIEYVTFDAAPSKADTNQVLQQLLAVKDEFVTTTDPESFITRNGSEIPYYDGYLAKSKIQVPNADTILALANGAVYGPYIDNNNFVMAKMIGRRYNAG